MGKVYYINQKKKKRNTAGAKAPDDIARICKSAGYQEFEMPVYPGEKSMPYKAIWLITVCFRYWFRLNKQLKDGDIVICQHPMYGDILAARAIPAMKRKKNVKFVVLIHDLESLRQGIEGVIQDRKKKNAYVDRILLKQYDALICHNEKMKAYLVAQGFPPEKIVCLQIFDYLAEGELKEGRLKKTCSVAIAGNLAAGKCRYIYDILDGVHNRNLTVNLYGLNFEEREARDGMRYHGSFSPDELPDKLEGSFGLVWDGTSAETCAGNTGNYLRYNNPHKTSLYLAAGMPVIIWKEAAIADFVLKNGIGITVDSLYELEATIREMPQEEYERMKKNALQIGYRLRAGFYFKGALERILQCLNTD